MNDISKTQHEGTVLLVDDDAVFRRTAGRALERRGYSVMYAEDGEHALKHESLAQCDTAVVDLNMPGMDGLELLEHLQAKRDDLPVIVLTGYGSINTAIDAIKLGAFHYLTKPCEISHLEIYLKKALEQRAIELENKHLRDAIQRSEASHGIVGESPAIKHVLAMIERMKDSDAPVLVTGESGTGKELVARALHFQGRRQAAPFIAINCATLKPELLENELFGHVAGAFTGATSQKDGLLTVANHGTLFIDEIADMDPNVQASLLRVIETGEFRPLGSTTIQTTNTRIVAAANRDLTERVKSGFFREDLFYRLNVLVIHSPPLRERSEDISLLINHYLNRSAQGRGMAFSEEALEVLMHYNWPGNIRELFNICERAVLLSNNSIITREEIETLLSMKSPLSNLHSSKEETNQEPFVPQSLEEAEKKHIKETLAYTNQNVSQTAELLGIDRRTLQRKMARYGLRVQ